MNKIEEALWLDYEYAGQWVEGLADDEKTNTDRLRIATEERDKIRNELIKIEQLKSDKEYHDEQNCIESRKELTRNILSMVTFGISTGLTLFTIIKTFKFDQTSTVTSTLGRNILNGVIPKFKR